MPEHDPTPRLLEREHELAVVAGCIQRLVDGTGSVVCVSGAAGLGKTTLVERAAGAARGDVVVVSGSCEDLTTPRPLGPFRDMLLPDGDPLIEGPEAMSDPGSALRRLRQLASTGRPPMVVVEDAHWADDASVDVLRILVRHVRDLPALVVITYRDEDIDAEHPMRRLLGSLRAPVHRLALAPLSATAIAELAAGTGLVAEEVSAATGGNPFFVSEVLAHPGLDRSVPTTVRDAVLGRLGATSPATRAGLQILSVIPARVEHWLATALLDDPTAVLAEAERRSLLDADGSHVWFRHELARRAIEASLTTAERLQHNRAVADVLAARAADPARIVHHAALADADALVAEWAALAAEQAIAAGAHRQAERHLEHLLTRRDRLAAADVATALTQRAHSLYLVNRFAESLRCAQEAVGEWETVRDPEGLATALVGLARTSLWAIGPRTAERAAERALAESSDARLPAPLVASIHAELARARGNLATLGPVSEPSQGALSNAAASVEAAQSCSRDDLLAHALTYLGAEKLSNGDPTGWSDLDRAIALARQDPRVEFVARAHVNASGAAFRAGRPEVALGHVEAGLAHCAGGEFFAGEYRLQLTRCVVRFATGEWAAAEAELRALLARAGEPGLMGPMAATLLARLVARRGEQDAAAEILRPALAAAADSDEAHLLGPVATAAVELAWLADDVATPGLADRALDVARRTRHLVTQAEVTAYLRRSGQTVPTPAGAPGPWAAALAGEHGRAAGEWAALGESYESAVESWADGSRRTAAEVLERLGATATLAALAR
jgi:hypothetical protein